MSDPFMGEIRINAFPFAQKGWAFCDGRTMQISQNQALFALLGTTYGGNGQTTFALPDMRGRVPIHRSDSHQQGERGGEQAHTLTSAELPTHVHPLYGSMAAASSGTPGGAMIGGKGRLGRDVMSPSGNTVLASNSVANTGGAQPHLNMQPFLALNFSIALTGLFPSRS